MHRTRQCVDVQHAQYLGRTAMIFYPVRDDRWAGVTSIFGGLEKEMVRRGVVQHPQPNLVNRLMS